MTGEKKNKQISKGEKNQREGGRERGTTDNGNDLILYVCLSYIITQIYNVQLNTHIRDKLR